MQNNMLAKILTLKVICIKFIRNIYKTYRIFVETPRSLPTRITLKLKSIIRSRVDLSFFVRNKIRIFGGFYPREDLSSSSNSGGLTKLSKPIGIIIPVYRNVAITKRCIDSVLDSNISGKIKIFVLNDCSPDLGMSEVLDAYRRDHRVVVIHNPENLGFVRNVNKGMKLAGDADVVLLNSDTIVAGDWLLNLQSHSCSRDNVSSVTATSNNATICSFPTMEGRSSWPMGLSTKQVQDYLSKHNKGRSVEIPTAVGFCMYITRRSLNAIGDFDAEAFGKGYGEENDFCLRGIKKGWVHLQALDTGVFHEGEVSFGASSHPGKEKASVIITNRYPHYNASVGSHIANDPARAFRIGALLAMLSSAGKPVELICTHVHGGGVEKAVSDFARCRRTDANFLILRRSAYKGIYQISGLIEGENFHFDFSSRYSPDFFREILAIANISKIHIHHVMDFDRWMLQLLKESKIPFDFHIHDYWTICPQITLTTMIGRYCGEPDEKVCNSCISMRSMRGQSPLPAGLPRDMRNWREQYKWLFENAEQITAPSQDTTNRFNRYYPRAKISTKYHELQEPLLAAPMRLPKLSPDENFKVAVIGAIGVHKGIYLVSELQGAIERASAPVDLKVIGTIDTTAKIPHNVIFTGAYSDKDLKDILLSHDIHAIWFPEGAPETYSYTLSHALKNGYPIIAPNIGAFPERLNGRPWSFVTDLNSTGESVLNQLLSLRQKIIAKLDP